MTTEAQFDPEITEIMKAQEYAAALDEEARSLEWEMGDAPTDEQLDEMHWIKMQRLEQTRFIHGVEDADAPPDLS